MADHSLPAPRTRRDHWKRSSEFASSPDFRRRKRCHCTEFADLLLQHPLRAITLLLRGKPELARRLVIEITETAALHDIEESARFVGALRELGCRIALDDFGAGFTSLRHLQTLAVDIVKIDGSFVRNLGQNYDNQMFLRHLVGLAGGLGLATVAECVETAREAAILQREGVGYLQGYFIGKPAIERPWATAEEPRARREAAAS